jgi:glucokinase
MHQFYSRSLASLRRVSGLNYYIAVDVGATKTRIAIADASGILDKVVINTPRDGDEYTISNLIIKIIGEKWGQLVGNIRAIGIATIGPLDLKRGVVVNTPNLNMKRIELLNPLVDFFKTQVYVVNDCVAAAWGEKHYGDAVSVDNYVYITLSTGVGAGVVVDGELLIGKMGNAHEVGHIVVDFDSVIRCGCGGWGHWEAYAGGRNLPRVAEYLLNRGIIYSGSELAELVKKGFDIDAKVVFNYYRRGDPLAKDLVDLYVKATAAGLASVINSYDPELVTIGGGVFLNNIDVLYEPIVKLTRENIVTEMPIIKPTRLGDDVGLYGALAIAVDPPRKLREIQSSAFTRDAT